MIWFLGLLASYVLALAFIQPEPKSLKDSKLPLLENIKTIKASIGLGIVLIVAFFLITDLTFITINETAYALLALSNMDELKILWPIQAITHTFIHGHWLHLVMNVSLLALASAYERRVGAKRFLAVYAAGTLMSIPSIFFYSQPVLMTGASAGILALAAGFFTDHKNLTIKEWLGATLLFFILMALFSIKGEVDNIEIHSFDLTTDHIGHVLGALGGILYCRLTQNKSTQ